MISPGVFSYFQSFDFLVCEWGKNAKKAQNDKKLYLLCSTSQESYIIWFSFMVHRCKMVSPGVFFSFFQNFNFKRAKDSPKWQKILSVMLLISGIIHQMIVIYGTLVQDDDFSGCFFHFSKILILQVVRGSKMRKNCQSGSIPQEPYVIWFSFMLHMCKMISPVFLRFFEMLILGVSIS